MALPDWFSASMDGGKHRGHDFEKLQGAAFGSYQVPLLPEKRAHYKIHSTMDTARFEVVVDLTFHCVLL